MPDPYVSSGEAGAAAAAWRYATDRFLSPSRNDQDDDRRATDGDEGLSRTRRVACDVCAQDAIDAASQQAVAVDAYPLPRDATAAPADRLRHIDQDFRITPTLANGLHRLVVAGLFGCGGKGALEPPRKGMEPEKATVQPRETCN